MLKTEFIEILRKNYNRMLLTKKETAHELNISTATIDRLRKSGELNSKKVSGMILFSLDEIARFVYET
ncbi:MAG: helix-turn-helix domain-containing protein [Poseidonibacter sp.]|uniref:helix-turn-helix domain-containing protein n=1 Tax=Poseidonibacter sp. TaxID=2321188 RepID=UPI00359D3C46